MNLLATYQQQKSAMWSWATLTPVMPAIIVIYACLLPRELTISLDEIDFRPYRVALLLVAPFVLGIAIRRPLKLSIIDLFAAIVAVWFVISLLVVDTFEAALITGISQGADFALAYLTGRVVIRSTQDFKLVIAAVLPGLLVTAAILAVESISHKMLLRPYLAEWLNRPRPDLRNETRMGLMRAAGPFPHPILGGVFLASLLPIVWSASISVRNRILGVCVALSCIFTVSSAGVLVLLMSFGLLVTSYVQRLTRWPIFMVGALYAGVAGLAISLASEGGLVLFLIRRLTFDARTGSYRQLIWEYGGAEVWRHPLFGIGTADWLRPAWMVSDSVDAHWLLISMQYGLVTGVFYFLVVVGAVFVLLRRTRESALPVKLVAGAIAFSLISLVFAGFTVFLWEGILVWMVMLAGVAVSIGTDDLAGSPSDQQNTRALSWQERILQRRFPG